MSEFYATPPSINSIIITPVEPNTPPKSHFFKKIYGVFIAITVLAIGVFICLQFLYNTRESSEIDNSKSPEWKTYVNKSLNYSIKYPSNWKFQEVSNTENNIVEFSPLSDADGVHEYISIEINARDTSLKSSTFEKYIKMENDTWRDTEYDIKKVVTQKENIGYTVSWEVDPSESENGTKSSASTYFEILGDNSSAIQVLMSNDKYLDIYEKMVSSFANSLL